MITEAEPAGLWPQVKEGRHPLEARRGQEQLLPWNLQKEPSLLTPGLQLWKFHLGPVPSVTVGERTESQQPQGSGDPCNGSETVGKMDETGVSAGVEGATAGSQGTVVEGRGGSGRHEGGAGLERNYTVAIPGPWLRWERWEEGGKPGPGFWFG